MGAKLVVTPRKGGSRIALVGTSGTELLSSKVFTEPRAKGATLRSLRAMLGEDFVVEDHTLSSARATTLAAGVKRSRGSSDAIAARKTVSRRQKASVTK